METHTHTKFYLSRAEIVLATSQEKALSVRLEGSIREWGQTHIALQPTSGCVCVCVCVGSQVGMNEGLICILL